MSAWLLSWTAPAWSQALDEEKKVSGGERANEEAPRTSSSQKDGVAGESPNRTPDRLSVLLVLLDTSLTREATLAALEDEFEVPIVDTTQGYSLVVRVEGSTLTVSFTDEDGQVVRRTITLPKDEARQLDAIALLSGNLARDEAAALLAQLEAEPEPAPKAESRSGESPLLSPAPTPLPEDEDEDGRDEDRDDEDEDGRDEDGDDEDKDEDDEDDDRSLGEEKKAQGTLLEESWLSVSLTSNMTLPGNLEERRAHFELGFVNSRIGALDGIAVSSLVSSNRGLDAPRVGRGGQIALLWTQKDGPFEGALVSLGSASHDSLRGVQLTGLLGLQLGALAGVQWAGLHAHAVGTVRGAQLGGIASVTVGDVSGAQLGGVGALTTGPFRGVQVGSVFAASGGTFQGIQIASVVSTAPRLSGAQLAVFPIAGESNALQLGVGNTAYQQLNGLQLGVVNVAGSWSGTQIGVINVAGKGSGTQIGLLNVAAYNQGQSVGMIDIVPGIRTQLLTYASYTPSPGLEGIASGPLGYVGVKFLSRPLYTHLSFGAGPEGEECVVIDGTGGEENCFGGQEAYASAFGLGLHADLVGPLFAEFDLTYQLELGFRSSRSSRHSAMLRSALGVQLIPAVALFAGAGPRLDFYGGPRVDPSPDVGFSPIFFGGLQFF